MSWISVTILVLFVPLCVLRRICFSATIPPDFVYVSDVIPDIQISLRYASEENFLGAVVTGYLANVSILTRAAAMGLKQAQALAKENGYELVIYDGYRPQKSVDHFMNWSSDPRGSQLKKSFYYPRVNKEDAFKLGYIAEKSGHTRGSTVDLTLIQLGKHRRNPLVAVERSLTDNSTIFYLDDGTIDMGSSFDLFDEASHINSTLVNQTYQTRRFLLNDVMKQAGFSNYQKEWWHYTLDNEPFPNTYFDFDIQSSCTLANFDPTISFFLPLIFLYYFKSICI